MIKWPLLVVFSISLTAHARLLPDVTSTNGDKEDYRLGDEWGKKRVTERVLAKSDRVFERAAGATAYLPVGGTAFYLGKFNGMHILATNHHVCPEKQDCVGGNANFRVLNKSFPMKKMFLSIPDIDLALLQMEVAPKDEAVMSKVARNFSFDRQIQKGQGLLTIGFGVGGNPQNYMMANQDSDCKVFSATGEYRHLADPDEFNPAGYRAWSFAHACDISHGDSGSAMIDRKTGDVVGIVWTGKIPKSSLVQSSTNLKKIFNSSSSAVWKELSYAVPAVKIKDVLKSVASDSQTDSETKTLIKALIR